MDMTSAERHAISTMAEHLRDGTSVLFLGAGANAGVVRQDGTQFPLGNDLAKRIAADLLADPNASLSLADAGDMARRKLGEQELNNYLREQLVNYEPGVAQFCSVRLPWAAIYTTNYDTLIETAAERLHRRVHMVSSMQTNLSEIPAGVTPYYKLHGCIDFANTREGRLVLTPEDYEAAEENRSTLFRRLRSDILSKAFIFVGYGFKDNDLRTILDQVRYALGTDHLPPSFALRQSFSRSELEYWKDKYNVQLVESDAAKFLSQLSETYEADTSPRRSETPRIGGTVTEFPIIGGVFEQIIPAACVGSSSPETFFRGGSYTWNDARDKVAPPRSDYWTVLEYLFSDFTDPTSPPTCFLISGAAGTGKTTLCRTIGFDCAKDLDLKVLSHIPGTPLDPSVLGSLVDLEVPRRILVLIKDAASSIAQIEAFMTQAKRLKWPVTLLLEERRNEWLPAQARYRGFSPSEIVLGEVQPDEIDRILDALERHGCLGRLEGLDRFHQQQHFAKVASQDLLVALRQLTSESTFDETIRDEYESIPSLIAKRAYLFVSAVGQANVPLRYEHLIRLTGVSYGDLSTEILRPTDRILIDGEAVGYGTVSSGYTLRTRHPVIASVIFNSATTDDQERYGVILSIANCLDPGYPEDRRLLEELVRRHEIVGTLSDPHKARAIFEVVASKLPGTPFVLQQRSVLERNLGDAKRAVEFAQEALQIDRQNPSVRNTYGFALEMLGRNSDDPLKRAGCLNQARKLFQENIDRDPSNAYNYLGLAQVMRTEAQSLAFEERALGQANVLAFLEDAFRATNGSEIVAKMLAEEQRSAGDSVEALRIVSKALLAKAGDTRLRVLHVKLLVASDRDTEALQSGLQGLHLDPNSWQLNLAVARLLWKTGKAVPSIRSHFEAARRHQSRDIELAVEYGTFLFISGLYSKAADVFGESQNLPVEASAKRIYRKHWRESATSRRDVIFEGRVGSVRGTAIFVTAVPQNFEVRAWQQGERILRVGQQVRFTVSFNAYGANARLLPAL